MLMETNAVGAVRSNPLNANSLKFAAALRSLLDQNEAYSKLMAQILEIERNELERLFRNPGKRVNPSASEFKKKSRLCSEANKLYISCYIQTMLELGMMGGSALDKLERHIRLACTERHWETPSAPELLKDKASGNYYVSLVVSGIRTNWDLYVKTQVEAIELLTAQGELKQDVVTVARQKLRTPLKGAVDEFQRHMKDFNCLAPKTRLNHMKVVSEFLRRKDVPNVLTEINESHIHEFLNSDEAKKRAFSTRCEKRQSLKKFFGFCHKKGLLKYNPVQLVKIDHRGVPFNLREIRSSDPFTDEEVWQIINDPKTSKFYRLATAIGRWTGIRLGDICLLQPGSFAKSGKVIVWTEKRDRRVEIPLEPELEPFLAELPEPRHGYYFQCERHQVNDVACRWAVSQGFKRILKRLGIKGRTFKSLRVSYCRMMQDRGEPMPHIARAMGHSSTKTTRTYYARQENTL